MKVWEQLLAIKARRGGGFFLLLDPDRLPGKELLRLAEEAQDGDVDAILVGTSIMLNTNFHHTVRQVKEHTALPVIIFPGSHSQITPYADAVLFTSLISGRNPQYLIDEQVKGAPLIKEYGIEPIATGYMLIDSGKYTSVQYISGTLPIPADKNDIACAHALAAQYLGMKLLFMEAGSGASRSVPEPMIEAVSRYVELPMMVGGGISSPEEAGRKMTAGASFVVVGNHFEKGSNGALMHEFADAVHTLEKVTI
jgi:phosphoglycerol geranylgeranyltransferase